MLFRSIQQFDVMDGRHGTDLLDLRFQGNAPVGLLICRYSNVPDRFYNMPIKAIGYVRVSTDKQADRGVSLEAQVEKIRAMATVHDVELVDVLVDAGERALADVTANGAAEVVGGEAGEAHGAGLDGAVQRAVGILLAHRTRDDELVVHLHTFLEEVFGQVGTVEADGLVGVVAVVVVPVENGGGRLAGQGERVHEI